jgi:hypothetical protein
MSLLTEIKKLPPEELVELKNNIIDNIDKRRYSKEVLENLEKQDAIATVNWLKKRYGI